MQEDLNRFYKLVKKRQEKLGKLYDVLENKGSKEDEKTVEELLSVAKLPKTKENMVAVIGRIVAMREEGIVQAYDEAGVSEDDQKALRHDLYEYVRDYHLGLHVEVLETLEKEKLLSPFYRTLLWGVHEVGKVLSHWQMSWTKHIIEDINEELKAKFSSSADVMEMLKEKDLLDLDHYGDVADRSYSVLKRDGDFYVSQAYAEAFWEEVEEVVLRLSELIEALEELEDKEFNQKESYIAYFDALRVAFKENDRAKLVPAWANVDRAWMSVTAPIQVGHPLEYYEDHYRKAVALEWDVRLSNPEDKDADKTKAKILDMYEKLFDEVSEAEQKDVYTKSVANVGRVQLYIGRPALYYGAEFNGLFSAQVVPNDEVVSQEFGKKIFAFADNVLDSIKAKPFLKISRLVFGEEFLNSERELVFKKPALWHRVYDATTIGHEFGHVLWMDETSEAVMNKSGMFKNIEEFKATTGGLVSFYLNEDEEISSYVMSDTIKRAVGLISWMKTGEVEPYYCEGLIHLTGLFETKVLDFDKTLHVDTSKEAFERMKEWYINTYKELGRHYLDKKDAALFLKRFATKNSEGHFMPNDEKVKSFVDYYWQLHCEMGRVIDEESDKSQWL